MGWNDYYRFRFSVTRSNLDPTAPRFFWLRLSIGGWGLPYFIAMAALSGVRGLKSEMTAGAAIAFWLVVTFYVVSLFAESFARVVLRVIAWGAIAVMVSPLAPPLLRSVVVIRLDPVLTGLTLSYCALVAWPAFSLLRTLRRSRDGAPDTER